MIIQNNPVKPFWNYCSTSYWEILDEKWNHLKYIWILAKIWGVQFKNSILWIYVTGLNSKLIICDLKDITASLDLNSSCTLKGLDQTVTRISFYYSHQGGP